MPASPLERLRGAGEGRSADNNRRPTTDNRGGYDSFYPGHTPAYQPKDSIRPTNARHYNTDEPPTGPRHQLCDRRQPMPYAPFDDRYPVESSVINGRIRGGVLDSDVGRYEKTSNAARGDEARGSLSAARPEHHDTNKRPAPSLRTSFENENPTKRQRYTPKDEGSVLISSKQPVPLSRADASIKAEVRQSGGQIDKHVEPKGAAKTYIDAGTQTEIVPITSSKLVMLQEEQAIVKIKHEAEMARMQENMDRTFEHERRMLELRNSFRGPTPQKDQSLPAANGFSSPVLSDISKKVAEPTSALKHGSGVKQTGRRDGPSVPPQEPAQEVRIMGASLNPSIVSQVLREPDPVGKVLASENPSAILDRLLGTPPDPSTQNHVISRLKALDKPFDNPSSEGKRRPQSAESDSVQIKTSLSPGPVKHDNMMPEPRRFPRVHHLTCYFWKHGTCTKTANQCSYAHYDTGSVAMAPDSLKKMKRDGAYYRSGGW